MRDLPTGPELMALADEWAAKVDTVPPEERALTLAMIERCRAIAIREAAAGEAAMTPIRRELGALYGGGDVPAFARLTAEIRAGRLDKPGAERARVRALLWALTLQKLRESNLRFLTAHGIE